MHPFNSIIEEAQTKGVEIKNFCSYCTNDATGELMMDDGEGNVFPLPICEDCVEILQKKYSEKFDNS
jgi:hypothetical protein